MKQFLLFLIGVVTILHLQAQDPKTEIKPRRFHIGLDYSFIRTDMKLIYMTQQNTWNGIEYDIRKLEKEEIDDMNSREEFTRKFQSFSLEIGMVMLNKPEGKWFIDGTLMIGIAKPYYRIYNTQTDTVELQIESGFSMLTAGVKFTFRYNFTPHWGLGLSPYIGYSFGTNNKIDDNTYGHIEYFNEARRNGYIYWYSRTNLLASYTFRGFTVSAGPGFYLLFNSNDFRLERTDPVAGDTYLTEIKSRLISKSFVDATISIDWRIIDPLTISVYGALGNDFIAHGGIRYNF